MRTKTFVAILVVLLLSGCSNFDEINTDPNTTTVVNASMLCTSVLVKIAAYDGADAKAYIAESAFPKYVGYANELQLESQYNLIGNGSFSKMSILPNIERMLVYAEEGVTPNAYKGVAKFARAYMFYKLTMQMGDIPYTQAGGGEENVYRPIYDAQEDVLIGILDELEDASNYFASGETFAGDPTPYNGNSGKWQRACNAFRLKVLMSLSNLEGKTSIDVRGRFREIVQENKLLDASTGFWGLEYSATNAHPLYSASNMFTSRTILSDLFLTNLKSLGDRRMYYFAEPANTKIDAGISESSPEAYVGADVSMDYTAMSSNFTAGMYSIINLRYHLEQASESRRLITYAEQQLILAEARIRGWITTGDAQNYYETGVASALSSMMEVNNKYAHGMPIDQAYIDGYFTGEAAFKLSGEEQLKQIWMQRYLLNFLMDGVSAYFEYRRTGYPVFPVNPETSLNVNNKNGIPMRWLYPSTEPLYNSKNYSEAVSGQYEGYDEINKLMWVLK